MLFTIPIMEFVYVFLACTKALSFLTILMMNNESQHCLQWQGCQNIPCHFMIFRSAHAFSFSCFSFICYLNQSQGSPFWLPTAPDLHDLWTLLPDLSRDNSPNKQLLSPVTWSHHLSDALLCSAELSTHPVWPQKPDTTQTTVAPVLT